MYNGDAISDIICKKGDKYYYYNSLKGNDAELDKFATDNLNLDLFKSSKVWKLYSSYHIDPNRLPIYNY